MSLGSPFFGKGLAPLVDGDLFYNTLNTKNSSCCYYHPIVHLGADIWASVTPGHQRSHRSSQRSCDSGLLIETISLRSPAPKYNLAYLTSWDLYIPFSSNLIYIHKVCKCTIE